MQIWSSSSSTGGAISILDLIEGSHIHTLDLKRGKILLNAFNKKKKKNEPGDFSLFHCLNH